MTGKSATLESKVLSHLFMEEPLEAPCEWWLELLQDAVRVTSPTTAVPADLEVAALRVVGPRTKIRSWTKVQPTITEAETNHALVYNTHEIILPFPTDDSVWQATHFAIWSGSATDVDAYLMYWASLEDTISITKNSPKSFKSGDLIIREF